MAIRRNGWLAVSFIIKISIRNRSKGSHYQRGSRQLCIGRKSFWMDSVKEDPLKLHAEVRPANSPKIVSKFNAKGCPKVASNMSNVVLMLPTLCFWTIKITRFFSKKVQIIEVPSPTNPYPLYIFLAEN